MCGGAGKMPAGLPSESAVISTPLGMRSPLERLLHCPETLVAQTATVGAFRLTLDCQQDLVSPSNNVISRMPDAETYAEAQEAI